MRISAKKKILSLIFLRFSRQHVRVVVRVFPFKRFCHTHPTRLLFQEKRKKKN